MTNADDFLQFIDFGLLPMALVVLVAGVVLVRVVGGSLDRLGERFGERRLLFKQISAFSRFVIWFVLSLAVLSSILKAGALLAIAGILGVAFGFAFKDLLASLMAGVILLVDQPFQVGDRIAFGPHYGEVREIGLRSVRLVTLDDSTVTIPNSSFLSETVASANAGALDCMVVVPVYVDPAEDGDRVEAIVEEAALTSPFVFLDKPVITLISDEFTDRRFCTVVRLKAYVLDARYEKAFSADITRRVRRAFAAEGIRGPAGRLPNEDALPDAEVLAD